MEEYTEETQRETFYDYYVREIEPDVIKYEFQRNKLKNMFIKLCCIIAVFICVCFWLLSKYGTELIGLGNIKFKIICLIPIPIVLFYIKYVTPLIDSITNKVTPKLLKYFDIKKLEISKDKEEFIDRYLRSLEINPGFHYLSIENNLKKQYKGTDINIIEVNICKGQGRYRSNTSPGILIYFKNPNTEKTELVIKQNENFIKNALQYNGLPPLKIGNSQFERVFNVYTDNPEYAKNILNHNFIKKLLILKQNNKYSSFSLSFEKNNVNIFLELNKNLFQYSPLRKTYDFEQYKEIVSNIQYIFNIIDDLELI